MNPAAPMKPPMDGCDRFAAALARLGVCPGDRAFVSGEDGKRPARLSTLRARRGQLQTTEVAAVCEQCMLAALDDADAAVRWYVRHDRVFPEVAVGDATAAWSVKALQAVTQASIEA